jgi:hypothetical protein
VAVHGGAQQAHCLISSARAAGRKGKRADIGMSPMR